MDGSLYSRLNGEVINFPSHGSKCLYEWVIVGFFCHGIGGEFVLAMCEFLEFDNI